MAPVGDKGIVLHQPEGDDAVHIPVEPRLRPLHLQQQIQAAVVQIHADHAGLDKDQDDDEGGRQQHELRRPHARPLHGPSLGCSPIRIPRKAVTAAGRQARATITLETVLGREAVCVISIVRQV